MAKRRAYVRSFDTLKEAEKRAKSMQKKYGVKAKIETRTVKGRKRYEVYVSS